MASIPEARSSFNLKVLRRHDPSIVEIVETASFVVLYNYNGGEWTKTGVEGPLFLFRRRLPPYNGFFLMNRNGVENFSADVTPDDDLEITPEFIIYRPETSGDNEVYGIWVFEPNQRMAVGDKMLKLQQMVEAPSEEQIKTADKGDSVAAVSANVSADGKTVTEGTKEVVEKEKEKAKENKAKGKANGKPKKGAKQHSAEKNVGINHDEASAKSVAPSTSSAAADGEASTQINLDDLFGSAPTTTQTTSIPQDSQPEQAQGRTAEPASIAAANGASLLDSLFQNAVSLDSAPSSAPVATARKEPESATNSNNKSEENAAHAQNLLSLLGGATPSTTAQPEPQSETTSQQQQQQQQPSTSSTSSSSAAAAAAAAATVAPVAGREEARVGDAPKMSELLEQNIRDRIGLGDDGSPLSRREFVTELLSMVHTNPDFVSELYASYVQRVSS